MHTYRKWNATLAALALAGFAAPAFAGPSDPVTVSLPPEGQGPVFSPGTRLVAELEQPYVEEEYFVSGAATLYNYAHNPPSSPTDIVAAQAGVPYQTRMIVRRPVHKGQFNGSVVIEWWNSTAGFDTAPAWDASAEHFAREGYAYVGVTNSTTSIGFLLGGCRVLNLPPSRCGTRYATLSMPENGLAWDIVSQIASLLRSDSPDNPLPSDFRVARLFHVGESQQGGSIVTYASGFHLPGVNDGYFIQSATSARPINFGPACGAGGSPPFPDCTPRLPFPMSLVRTDLPVPVYQVVTELDVANLFGIIGRQAETPTFRYYEVAGGAHNTVHKNIEIVPPGIFGPNPILLEDLCLSEINSTADGPVFVSHVFNALWERMSEQVRRGSEPPASVLLDWVGPNVTPIQPNQPVVLARDALGNATGGVRVPAVEVPVATYVTTVPGTLSGNVANPALPGPLVGIGNLACRLSGSVIPFKPELIDALYGNHGGYMSRVAHAANALQAQGLLLPKDAKKIRVEAAMSSVACGIGFELAFVLPPILWLRRRTRR